VVAIKGGEDARGELGSDVFYHIDDLSIGYHIDLMRYIRSNE
jgi:hypothetical protein